MLSPFSFRQSIHRQIQAEECAAPAEAADARYPSGRWRAAGNDAHIAAAHVCIENFVHRAALLLDVQHHIGLAEEKRSGGSRRGQVAVYIELVSREPRTVVGDQGAAGDQRVGKFCRARRFEQGQEAARQAAGERAMGRCAKRFIVGN